MRVLQLISSVGLYGAENVLLALASGVREMGCDVVVGALENEHSPHIEVALQARQRGLRAEVFPCRGRFDRRTRDLLREFVRNNRIDLIHSHGYKSHFYALWAARGLGTGLVGTCHTGVDKPERTRALRLYAVLERLLLARFDAAVAVSEAIAASLRRWVAAERLFTIRNGIDWQGFQRAAGSNVGRTVVGSVGRLVSPKGFHHLLTAAREVLQVFPDTLFLLAGDGPERAALEAQARQLGISGAVCFPGHCPDIPGLFASFDIFVLPSLNEGLPLSVLEAMAAGTPVIATRVGAVPSVVIPDQTGLLVEPGDAAGLRDAILGLLRDPERGRPMAERARGTVREGYSASAMAARYLKVYFQAKRLQARVPRLRQLVKWVWIHLLKASGAFWWARRVLRRRGAIVVLLLHRIADGENYESRHLIPGMAIGLAAWRASLEYLKAHCRFVDPSRARPGPDPGPLRVALTFDDGWREVGTLGWPAAREYGAPLTVFACPGVGAGDRFNFCPFSSGPADGPLDGGEIRRLMAEGMGVGAHTYSHQVLTEATPEVVERELVEAKALLGDCESLAYPRGEWNPEVHRAVEEAGYRLAFTTREGAWTEDCDPLLIPRITLWDGAVNGPGGRFSRAYFEYLVFWKAYRASRAGPEGPAAG